MIHIDDQIEAQCKSLIIQARTENFVVDEIKEGIKAFLIDVADAQPELNDKWNMRFDKRVMSINEMDLLDERCFELAEHILNLSLSEEDVQEKFEKLIEVTMEPERQYHDHSFISSQYFQMINILGQSSPFLVPTQSVQHYLNSSGQP